MVSRDLVENCVWHGAAYVDPDCAVITPTAAAPVSSRAGGVTMINKRVMPYCINLLDGNVACMMGAQSGGSGYYAAVNPQLQVDLLNTTSMTFSAGAARSWHSRDAVGTAVSCIPLLHFTIMLLMLLLFKSS